EPEDVAQDEDGELARRQGLQGGHEGQGDGFGLLVAGLRAERHVDRSLEPRVGERLEPDDLAEPGRLRGFDLCPGPLPWGASGGRGGGSALGHRLVGIRYSQVRSEERPSNPPRPRQAVSSVSWRASSASWKEPRTREQRRRRP